MTMTKILRRLKEELSQAELLPTVPSTGCSNFLTPTPAVAPTYMMDADPSYVDDVALLVAAKRPKSLVHTLQQTMLITVRVFRGHGLRLNLKPGKTAITLQVRGPRRAGPARR